MIKTQVATEFCVSCGHYGYCMIYWGADCKRQGGKKTPRLKTRAAGEIQKASRLKAAQQRVELPVANVRRNAPPASEFQEFEKQKADRDLGMLKKISQMFEPIRTKAANW